MEIIVFLSIVIAVVAVLTSIFLVRRVKKQIAEMTDALVDVKNGNGNRRILSATKMCIRDRVIYEPYRIKVLNTINFKKSMKYNPFAYIRSEKGLYFMLFLKLMVLRTLMRYGS